MGMGIATLISWKCELGQEWLVGNGREWKHSIFPSVVDFEVYCKLLCKNSHCHSLCLLNTACINTACTFWSFGWFFSFLTVLRQILFSLLVICYLWYATNCGINSTHFKQTKVLPRVQHCVPWCQWWRDDHQVQTSNIMHIHIPSPGHTATWHYNTHRCVN